MKKQITEILLLTCALALSGCFQNQAVRGSKAGSKSSQNFEQLPLAAPLLTVAQTSYTFPNASGNDPYVATLTNSSSERVNELVIIRNFSSNAFSVTGDNCGSSIPAGASCSLTLVYSNTAAVIQTGYLTINYKDRNGTAQNPLLLSFSGPAAAASGGTAPPAAGSTPPASTPPAPTPAVTGPAVISSTYTTQKSQISCGTVTVRNRCNYPTRSTFDGVNCFVGAAPSWTTRVWYDPRYFAFYFSARSGASDVCGGVGTFDGVNCRYGDANGANPSASSTFKAFYFTPMTEQVPAVWQGDCPEGSSFDGNSCYYGTAPRPTATVEGEVEVWFVKSGGVFSYPPSGGNAPCGGLHWYDQGTGKCQVARIPTGVKGRIWAGVNFYLDPKNVTCVPR